MKPADVSVIVPTYCEAENMSLLIPRIERVFKQAGINGELVVVDDNSPDGTAAICNRFCDSHPVRVVVRNTERGLSSAVLAGMKVATGSTFVIIDGDLSHPPETIPELVRPLQRGDAEFVIGSRYVPGGALDKEWGLVRWLNSRFAALLVRPLTKAKDPLAGFFAVRRATVEAAIDVNPIGYKIGLELIVKARCERIVEIPICFAQREHGKSKLTFKEQISFLRHLFRLYAYCFLRSHGRSPLGWRRDSGTEQVRRPGKRSVRRC